MRYDGTNGLVITQFRKRAGLTQRDLAAMWSISRKTLNSWENNRRRPATDMMIIFINQYMEKDKYATTS